MRLTNDAWKLLGGFTSLAFVALMMVSTPARAEETREPCSDTQGHCCECSGKSPNVSCEASGNMGKASCTYEFCSTTLCLTV